uniref:Uncharacterized protein n=1 Tax=Macrostomum lignano TaxID=282301 RepID=A0A1I8F6Q8_9PLAT
MYTAVPQTPLSTCADPEPRTRSSGVDASPDNVALDGPDAASVERAADQDCRSLASSRASSIFSRSRSIGEAGAACTRAASICCSLAMEQSSYTSSRPDPDLSHSLIRLMRWQDIGRCIRKQCICISWPTLTLSSPSLTILKTVSSSCSLEAHGSSGMRFGSMDCVRDGPGADGPVDVASLAACCCCRRRVAFAAAFCRCSVRC